MIPFLFKHTIDCEKTPIVKINKLTFKNLFNYHFNVEDGEFTRPDLVSHKLILSWLYENFIIIEKPFEYEDFEVFASEYDKEIEKYDDFQNFLTKFYEEFGDTEEYTLGDIYSPKEIIKWVKKNFYVFANYNRMYREIYGSNKAFEDKKFYTEELSELSPEQIKSFGISSLMLLTESNVEFLPSKLKVAGYGYEFYINSEHIYNFIKELKANLNESYDTKLELVKHYSEL